MENGLSLLDFKQFMKQKKWIIIITMILVTVSFVVITFLSETGENDEPQSDEIQVEETNDIGDASVRDLLLEEELTQNDITSINEYLFEDAYEFRFYVENQDGSVYARTNLTEEILLSDEVITSVEEQTNTELELIQDHFLNIDYNSNNVVYTISIGAGNPEDNEAISNAYYNMISDNSIPVLNEKVVYLFEETPVSVQDENNIEDESSSETETEVEENNLIRNIVLSIIVGLILGLFFGMLLAYIYSVFETKIHALYNLNLNKSDVYISFSGETEKNDFVNEKLLHVVSYPTDKSKLLLCQNKETLIKLKDSLANTNYLDATFENEAYKVSPEYDFNEVIIITEDGMTDKGWYERQRNQIKVYKSINKIIRL